MILGYHGVTRAARRHDLSMLLVDPRRFRAQIELLVSAGFRFATVAELAGMAAGGDPPVGYAAISFDDGLRNNYTTALPILRDYGIPATVYVTIGFIEGVNPWIGAGGDNRMLSRDEILRLVEAGWELGAHTLSHPDLSRLGYEECRREIEGSKIELEAITGNPVATLAYPFGRYGATALMAAADSGLIAAVTTGRGGPDRFEWKRAMIGAADPMPLVVLKLADRYEPLLQSPPIDLARRWSKTLRERIQGLPRA